MSLFDQITPVPPDPIFGIVAAYRADSRESKIDLSVGVYHSETLKCLIMESVKAAEGLIFENEKQKTYLPMLGEKAFLDVSLKLVLGEAFFEKERNRTVIGQTVGGTGALRCGSEILAQIGFKKVYMPDPTWANHKAIFRRSGHEVELYPYFDHKENRLDFEKTFEFFKTIPEKSLVLMHASSHNPTGCDPTKEQWQELSNLFMKRGITPLFDTAYQGLSDGLDEDAYSMRLFADAGHEMFITNSYSKNFGLYGERVGNLIILTKSEKEASALESVVKQTIRASYSNPPKHGASIVTTILQDVNLRQLWEEELSRMRQRINGSRDKFAKAMLDRGRDGMYKHLTEKKGFFFLSGLSKEQSIRLRSEFAIYVPNSGRINLTGINDENIQCIIDAIIEVG